MSEEIKLEYMPTNRGVFAAEFNDLYGMRCCIQEPPLVTTEAIWLGPLSKSIKVSAKAACKFGIPNPNNESYVELGEEFDSYVLSPMMRLSREHAKALVPLLQKFIETGRL